MQRMNQRKNNPNDNNPDEILSYRKNTLAAAVNGDYIYIADAAHIAH